MLMTAMFEFDSTATPQLKQLPPEKLADALLALVNVLFNVVPLMR